MTPYDKLVEDVAKIIANYEAERVILNTHRYCARTAMAVILDRLGVVTVEMVAKGWIDKEDVTPDEIWRAMLAASPLSPIATSETGRQDKETRE